MQYHGKSIDSFESAMTMLLINNGYSSIPHIDCISQRCFAFRVINNEMRNWLIPAIEPAKAVEKVFELAGIQNMAEIIQNDSEIYDAMEQGCLLGPIEERIRYGVSNIYYEGKKKYIYICGKNRDYFIIHDPDGFPMRFMKQGEIRNTYLITNGCIAVRLLHGGNQIVEFDFSKILIEGMRCRKKLDDWNDIEKLIAIHSFNLPRRQELSLHFGLYNYLLQTNKIIELMVDENFMFEREQLEVNLIMTKMYECILRNKVRQFMCLKDKLFDYLEQLLGYRSPICC